MANFKRISKLSAAVVRADAAPAPCKGQTTSTEYATSKPARLKSSNTHACFTPYRATVVKVKKGGAIANLGTVLESQNVTATC